MGDHETGSLWSHILGKAMAGPLQGKTLQILPAKITTWQAWREEYPETTATMLPPTARTFTKAMMGPSEDFCLGLVHQGQVRHWRFDLLQENPLVNDALADLPVVVAFDRESTSAVVWNRKTEQGTLTFVHEGTAVVDQQTHSTWDLAKGTATGGPMRGTRLEATTAILSFRHAWLRFHPDTTRWEPDRQ